MDAVLDGVGVKAEFTELLGEFGDVVGVAVADGNYGMAAVKVCVDLTVFVPQGGVEAPDGLDVPEFVYLK